MNLKKLFSMVILSFILFGCRQTTNANIVYKDLSAEETYDKLQEIMEDDVSYFLTTSAESETSTAYREIYHIDSTYQNVFKRYDNANPEFNNQKTILYSVQDSENLYILTPNSDGTYTLMKDKHVAPDHLNQTYDTNEAIEVLNLKRFATSDSVSLTFSLKAQDYYKVNYILGENGYILQSTMTYYTDDTFTTPMDTPILKVDYSNYNEKSKQDIEKEVELIKSCDGLTYDEIISKIGNPQ